MGGGYLAPEQEGEQQSFFSQPQLPQQVIDEALCIGFNDRNSRLIICAYFMENIWNAVEARANEVVRADFIAQKDAR